MTDIKMSELSKQLRTKARMIIAGERIEWASETALMELAAGSIDKLVEEKRKLVEENEKLLQCLAVISNMCVGEVAMSYRLDAEEIGQLIYAATGKTNPELNRT